jgi:ABC-type glycerol-3-phosphate transport system permease component
MVNIAIQSTRLENRVSLIPISLTWKNFQRLFVEEEFASAMMNSFIVTVVALSISLFIGLTCAYILARSRFKYPVKPLLLLWILLVRIIPPITFALPLYIQMNSYNLLQTKIPIIAAHVLLNVPLVIWVMMGFFKTIPRELEESAKVDGATEWQLFTKVMVPVVLPGIAAVAIFGFMMSWNEYLYGVIFVQSPGQFTVPLKLATLNSEQELIEWGKVASGGIVSMIPVTFFMIGMQKFLIQGLTAGSVKE